MRTKIQGKPSELSRGRSCGNNKTDILSKPLGSLALYKDLPVVVIALLLSVSLLGSCAPTEDTQAIMDEYQLLNEEKQALTEQMVQLNLDTEDAERQNEEIILGLTELEDKRITEKNTISDLEVINEEIGEEEDQLSLILTKRKALMDGWQLYHSIPMITVAQERQFPEMEAFLDIIKTARSLQLKFIIPGQIPMGSRANEGLEGLEDPALQWYPLKEPYDSRSNLIVRLMDGYTQEAAREILDLYFTKDPMDQEAMYLEAQGRLYGKMSDEDVELKKTQLWGEARYFINKNDEDKMTVRVLFPVVDAGAEGWQGSEEDVHFYDHNITLVFTAYGWRVSEGVFPELGY